MDKKVYVFDFDGTLTTRDTLLLFIRYSKGEWTFWLGMLLFAPLLVLMKLHVLNNGQVKERVFRHFFRGMTEKEFNTWCELFAEDFAHILRPKGIQTLRQVLDGGHPVYIVSASIDRWVAPLLEAPKKGGIIGTEIEVKDGRLTGRFATPNCYGEEKVRRLRTLIPDLSDYYIIAFGDSQGDKALFRIADETHYKPFR